MSETTTETQTAETTETAKTFTQEDVNAMLAKQKREQFGDYGDLKTKAKAFDDLTEQAKTEQQRATEALTAAEKRASDAESTALRFQVAAEKGLTPAQAKRLVGSSREEMEADADELLETFKPAATQSDDPTAAVTAALDLGSRGTTTAAAGDPAADFAKFLQREMR